MELREIRTFLVLCEELHFSRTAARVHVAQSAVSYAIKSLEAELGTALFVRSKRRVALTQAGERFRERVSPALAALEQATDVARRVGQGHAGRLSLRFVLMSALTLVPRAIARYREAYPDVDIALEPGGSLDQLEAIRAGSCDIGFMPRQLAIEPLASIVIQRSPLVAVLPLAHPLASRKRIRLADLAAERFVSLKLQREPQTRDFFRRDCLAAGFEPNVILEAEQLEVLLAMVAAGLGVSCTPNLVSALQFPGVVMLPLIPSIQSLFTAVWDPRAPSPLTERFLSMLRAEVSAAGQ